MKIQWHGKDAFSLENSKNSVHFNHTAEGTFTALSTPGDHINQTDAKVFDLPGEFEVNGVLSQAFYTDNGENLVHKIVLDNTGIVYFGNLKSVPKTEFFEKLGENTDIVIVNLSSDFDDKNAKNLITQITPRLAILGGDNQYFPALVENLNAKTVEENPHPIKGLSDDNTEVIILPV